MQTRKKRNLEIERSMKRHRQMFFTVAMAIVVVVMLAVAWVIWDAQSRRWIMTFEGTRISTGDLRFFNFGAPFTTDAEREEAMQGLVNALVVMDMGERNGVGLRADEFEELEEFARELRGWISGDGPDPLANVSDRRMAELIGSWEMANFFGVGGMVRDRLMDIHVPGYTPDPVEFGMELQTYIFENRAFYADLQVKFIALVTPDDREPILSQLEEGVEFDDLVREYSIFHGEDADIEIIELQEFVQMLNLWHEWENLSALQEGEVSDFIESDDWHFLVQMYSRTEADDHDIIDSFRDGYMLRGRMQSFTRLVDAWMHEANFSINDRVFNNIS